MSKLKIIDLVTDTAGLDEDLRKGRIAILDIRRRPMPFGVPGYRVNLLSSNSAVENFRSFNLYLEISSTNLTVLYTRRLVR
jgi:hypothetical protein